MNGLHITIISVFQRIFILKRHLQKEIYQKRTSTLIEVEKRRQEIGYKTKSSRLIEHSAGWIELIHGFFSDCFKQTKQRCKYSPNVKFHYTDIRFRNIDGSILRTNIYSVFPYFKILDETIYSKILFLSNMDSFFALFNVLLNIDLLINLCFSTTDIRIILNNIPVPQLSPDIQNTYNTVKNIIIDNSSVRNGILMYKPAAEFNRLLSLHPDIANKLQKFVTDRVNLFKTESIKRFQNLYSTYLNDLVYMKTRNTIESIFDRTVVHWGVWFMDVYTISRMFV